MRSRLMLRREFERLVREVFRSLPPPILERLENVDIVVKRRPSPTELRRGRDPGRGSTLFGLYLGLPLARRGGHYNLALPDKIIVYQEPHEQAAGSWEELAAQVRRTLLHEIAHHLGIEEEEMKRLGLS